MTQDQLILLAKIREEVKQYPDMMHPIISAGINGFEKNIEEANQRAVDFEIAATAMFGLNKEARVSPQTKAYYNTLFNSKVQKHVEDCTINWRGLGE